MAVAAAAVVVARSNTDDAADDDDDVAAAAVAVVVADSPAIQHPMHRTCTHLMLIVAVVVAVLDGPTANVATMTTMPAPTETLTVVVGVVRLLGCSAPTPS